MRRFLAILCSVSMLTACASMETPVGDQKARCKEMKHRLIFNGAASTQMPSAQRSSEAEMDQLEQNYKTENCS